MSKLNLNDFLSKIANDHEVIRFPIQNIQPELTIMYLDIDDFETGLFKAHAKLRKKYNETLANIFLTTVEIKFDIKGTDFRTLSTEEYQNKLEDLFYTLENLVITRIQKRSPDGEMLTQMASE